ncbi:MAG: protoporphyrinogen oxidase [Bdellovibrionales bacterium]|nr:protoporphyrinogen oxidase [Bdellovibrionales bacterium]
MKKQPSNIAIIGGGIAGLSAAYYLQQFAPNTEFVLFEKNNHLGGNIQTRTEQGFLYETGPDAFLHKPIMEELISELALENELIATNKENRKLYLVKNGSLVEVPKAFYLMGPSKLLPFLFSSAFSFSTKLRTLMEPLIPTKKIDEDESLASFVTRRFGKGNLEEITQSMIGGIYTADPSNLSLQSTLPRFIEWEQKYGSVLRGLQKEMRNRDARGPQYNQFRSFQSGMQILIDAMEKTIPFSKIQKNALVQSIDRENQLWNIRVNGKKYTFDHLIMATPVRATVHLSNFLPTQAKQLLKSVQYSSCAILHFGFRKNQIAHDIAAMGMIVPNREKRSILASTFCSEKFAERSENDLVLLRVFMGGTLNQELLQESDDTLFHHALRDLKELLRIESDPIYQNILRWPDSMPQYTLGHKARMIEFHESIRNIENVQFVGNTYEGVGIPDLIERSKKIVTGLLDV